MQFCLFNKNGGFYLLWDRTALPSTGGKRGTRAVLLLCGRKACHEKSTILLLCVLLPETVGLGSSPRLATSLHQATASAAHLRRRGRSDGGIDRSHAVICIWRPKRSYWEKLCLPSAKDGFTQWPLAWPGFFIMMPFIFIAKLISYHDRTIARIAHR
jgi:hypothetical protein